MEHQFSSVAQSCPTLCDPMNRSTPGLPVRHQLLEFTQTHLILCRPRTFKNCESLRWRPVTYIILYIIYSSVGRESACNGGGPGSIPGSGRSTGEGISYPLQYSGLENSMDCIVHGVAKSQTRPNDFHFHTSIKKKQRKMNNYYNQCLLSSYYALGAQYLCSISP